MSLTAVKTKLPREKQALNWLIAPLAVALAMSFLIFKSTATDAASPVASPGEVCTQDNTVTADVVALEQAYLLNRFSAFVPAGMLYALKSDVVALDGTSNAGPGNAMLRPDKRPRPIVLRVNEGECLQVRFTNYLAETIVDEGGIPSQNGGRLPNHVQALPGSPSKPGLSMARKISVDMPGTRAASFHVTGLSIVPFTEDTCPEENVACGGDGSNVGLNSHKGIVFRHGKVPQSGEPYDLGSLAKPGQTVITRWLAEKDGAYFAYSMGAPVGGEGDGGQIGLGLFGSVNVEPAHSEWFRSQVDYKSLHEAAPQVSGKHPYANVDYTKEDAKGKPVFKLRKGHEIVHTDLNAIIVPPQTQTDECKPEKRAYGSHCAEPFREFTVIFHDEVHAQQAFPELADENNPLHLVKDGMGINYGVSSMGSLMMSTPAFKKNIWPAKNCPECRAEEFFLSSWANGDPALLIKYDGNDKPIGALYSDDPSNVHHSYLGDNVRFRNLHAGPKETHVFHLHAHQWVMDASEPNSTYLDSQTISPGATFSYDIEFGGSGNRNYTPGDSIFHCHLYPHFAQGMWELWRTHDAFTDGKPGLYNPATSSANDPQLMNLPDPEIAGGTETPALVPIPGFALAPMPSKEFRGYPFYIPGEKGHRPPQPVLDFDVDGPWADLTQDPPDKTKIVDGGLPRHVVDSGALFAFADTAENPQKGEKLRERALAIGGAPAQLIAERVAGQDKGSLALAAEWENLKIKPVALSGTVEEKVAMSFHEGTTSIPGLELVLNPNPLDGHMEWWQPKAYKTDTAALVGGQTKARAGLFYVNGRNRAQGAPYAEPCPEAAPQRDYRAAFIQTELTYNKHGWFDPQGRMIILENDIKDIIDADKRTSLPAPLFFRANSGECINFKSSNFVPSALNVDDFQMFTPTDTIGQHIHLVKFDVTSSDGSGNGYNYEDATFSPLEVQERIIAFNKTAAPADRLQLKEHPLFKPMGDIYEAATKHPERYGDLLKKGQCPPAQMDFSEAGSETYLDDLRKNHPFCGAQRTTQRWWADPFINRSSGQDNTLRTVFTHDHMGPSSHQQHGLYAGLVIEPANSIWTAVSSEFSSADVRAAAISPQPACNGVKLGADRNPLCDRLVGGSDLTKITDPHLLKGAGSLLGDIEPRPALKLRDDGGPTNTLVNVFAPTCIGNSDSTLNNDKAGSSHLLQSGQNHPPSSTCKPSHDTRREFTLAMADFGIAYNMALEPINPEPFGDNGFRDNSAIRFGRRHVAETLARPLAISSEDPGSQYFNYRHEPLALRISEATPDPVRGGWNYMQNSLRASLSATCSLVDQDCLGDTANGFSTYAHAKRDEQLAKQAMTVYPLPTTPELLKGNALRGNISRTAAIKTVEQWRRNFNCALYSKDRMPDSTGCDPLIERNEPWRVFGDPATPILPAYEGDRVQIRLIQGAQEAQHVFTMNGVKWHRNPGSGDPASGNNSGYVNAQPLGISEHFEFDIEASPIGNLVTDYLYFGSSVDQLWDGMWGVMRTYGAADPATDGVQDPMLKTSSEVFSLKPESYLAKLPEGAKPANDSQSYNVCSAAKPDGSNGRIYRHFKVSAVRACDLTASCGSKKQTGIEYNRRLGIQDANGLAYVLEKPSTRCVSQDAASATCQDNADDDTNAAILANLRGQFSAGRKLEPLILRAAAGECVHVRLRNLLPPRLADGPNTEKDAGKSEVSEANAYHNFLPMITDGFNYNQFAMSSSVGLSPGKVSLQPATSDGSNVGLNDVVVNQENYNEPNPPLPSVSLQGSLVPPCTGDPLVDGEGAVEDRCSTDYFWSMAEMPKADVSRNIPVEFGAVPLRDFGDPLKHPGHGLVGALVVGPKDSQVCTTNRYGYELQVKDKQGNPASVPVDSNPSAEICSADGQTRLYVDHTLIVQDAVFATRKGLPVADLAGAEEPDDYGVKALNYKTEPLWGRVGNDPSIGFSERNELIYSHALSSQVSASSPDTCEAGIAPLSPGNGAASQVEPRHHPCDPETPVMTVHQEDPAVRLNIVHPGGHTRQQGLAMSGFAWNPYPWKDNSRSFDAEASSKLRQGVFNGFGPMMGISLGLKRPGADGSANPAIDWPTLDYLFRSQASFIFDGGIWALLRVCPKNPGPTIAATKGANACQFQP